MRNISPLPKSDDKFWDGDVELKDMSKGKSHQHNFVQVTGTEIRCECGFGLFITHEDRLKEGHLYRGDQLIC